MTKRHPKYQNAILDDILDSKKTIRNRFLTFRIAKKAFSGGFDGSLSSRALDG